jgi:hypothetical protein
MGRWIRSLVLVLMQERGGEGVDVRLQIWISYDSKQLPKMNTKPFSQTLETSRRDSLFTNTLRPSPVVARNPQTCHFVATTVC